MHKKVILLAGKINCGKNFIHDLMVNELGYGKCKRSYFAKALKETARDGFKDYAIHLNQSVYDVLDIIDEAVSIETHQHDRATKILKNLLLEDRNWFEDKTDSSRIFLQNLGTDVVRNTIDEDWWVKCAAEEIEESNEEYFISTDLRFTSEFEALVRCLKDSKNTYSFYPIYIERAADTPENIASHESENGLNDFPEWYKTIDNNGSKEDTIAQVKTILGIING